MLNDIRRIGDTVDSKESLPPYKVEHSKEILKNASGYLHRVIDEEKYEFNVSYEDNFLVSASPYFKTASEIFAVSIAEVSTFWNDQRSHRAVKKYLQEQKGQKRKITRLFVFKNPYEANSYKNIMQANFNAYGRGLGGVFVCSSETYSNLISKIDIDRSFSNKILNQDFGILGYTYENNKLYLEAVLDPVNMKISKINIDDLKFIYRKEFIGLFNDLLEVSEGEFSQDNIILRWSEGIYNSNERWANCLKTIFENHDPMYYHKVVFKCEKENKDNLNDMLIDIVSLFENKKQILNIASIKLLKREYVGAVDGRFHGMLSVNEDFDFILMIKFFSKDDLVKYYKNELHSVYREEVYSKLNPNVVSLFKKMNSHETQSEKSSIYKKIEKMMTPFISRFDGSVHEPIRKIVEKNGISFGKLGR